MASAASDAMPKADPKAIEIGDSLVAVLKECCSDALSEEARTKMVGRGKCYCVVALLERVVGLWLCAQGVGVDEGPGTRPSVTPCCHCHAFSSTHPSRSMRFRPLRSSSLVLATSTF